MLIEITPFETHHGERSLGLIGMLASLKLCEAHTAQTRIKMNAQLACRTRLTIAQACELFGVAEEKFDLETRFVITVLKLTDFSGENRVESLTIVAGEAILQRSRTGVPIS